MAIGTPYNLGGSAQASGSSSLALTPLASATTAGDMLFAAAGVGVTTVTPTGVTDDKPHTYNQVASYVPSNALCIYLYGLENATALTTGNTITAAWSSTSSTKQLRTLACSGLATSSATDTGAIGTNSGTSVSPSGTTGTLATSAELLIACCKYGNAGGTITWAAGWTEIGTTLHSGSGTYLSVACKVVSSNAAVTAGATLGASAIWSMMVVPVKGATAGGLTVTTPALAGATVGVPYTAQETASSGVPPYTWDLSVGSLPAGLTMTAGSSGGGTDPITYVAANGGPDGSSGQSLSDYTTAQSTIGPLTGIKLFVSADLPSSWSDAVWSTGISLSALIAAFPNVVPLLCWNTQSSAAVIQKFCATIPAGQTVGFCWQQEAEGTGSGLTGAQFVSGFSNQADIIHAIGNPNLLTVVSSTWGQYMPQGRAFDGSFLPPGAKVDVYGMDIYQHQAGGSFNGATTWPSNGLANHSGFQRWLTLVKPLAAPLGRQIAITEYGVDDTGTLAARNARIQLDYASIKAHCGPAGDGAWSPFPMWTWLYWWHNMAGSNTHYKFTDAATVNTWKGIAAGSSSGGGTTTGGLISGTPTAAGTSNFTARATDSVSATATAAQSIVVSASNALSFDTTSLPGATVGVAYDVGLAASGGTTPYTFTVQSGTLPAGLSLVSGRVTGTPTVAGTAGFTLRVTDNAAAHVDNALSIAVAGGLMITTTSLPPAQAGIAYTTTLATSGGTAPMSWGVPVGPLPAGITLDPVAGTLSGTPTASGLYPLTLSVTDGAGLTDTQALSWLVNPSSGGLPPIGRRRFGGDASFWVMIVVGGNLELSPNATVQFYDQPTAGTQYTDLQTTGGAPIDSVTTDGFGEGGEFYGPDRVTSMYADANGGQGPRRKIIANDLGDLDVLLHDAFSGGLPGGSGGGTINNNYQITGLAPAGLVVTDPAFGAKGDGIADDTVAVNAALAAAGGTSAGTVFMPAGTYLLNGSSGLSLAVAGTRLAGSGPDTVIKIGASFSAAQAIAITADSCQVEALSIVGTSTTVTANPVCNGIEITAAQRVKVRGVFFQYINGYAIESAGGASRGCLDLMLSQLIIRNCAAGIHLLGVTGSNFLGEHMLSDVTMQQIGAASGGSANLDALFCEDITDVIVQGLNIGIAGGNTGSAVHIKGACATISLANPDFGANQTAGSAAACHIESGANGTPTDVTLTGGTIGGGSAAFQMDAGQDIRIVGTRIHQAYGSGIVVNAGEFSAVSAYLAANGQGGGTCYDIDTSGMSTGNARFLNCTLETAVGSGAGLVTRPVNTSTHGYYYTCAFIGSGTTPSTVFTGTPQIVRGCIGYNPRGSITAPTITASPFSSSTSQQDVTIIFTAINTLTAFKIAGTAVGVLPVAGVPYTIPARSALELDYSGAAPTWQWFGN